MASMEGSTTGTIERRSFLKTAAVERRGGRCRGDDAAAASRGPPAPKATCRATRTSTCSGVRPSDRRRRRSRRIRQLGRDRWLDEQLRPRSIGDRACEDLIDRLPELRISMRDKYETQDFDWNVMFALGQATIVRAAWSQRQLFEVMVRLLVEPPQRHEPRRSRLVQPPRLRPDGDPQARARPVRGHACSPRRSTPRCCTTSTTSARRRTTRTRTTVASCSSCTRSAWTAATPKTRCASRP